MRSNIYTDLGIDADSTKIMEDPQGFDARVKEKADELIEAMKSSSRFSHVLDEAKKESDSSDEALEEATRLTTPFDSEFYTELEEKADANLTYQVARQVQTLAKDLMNLFESQVRDGQLQQANSLEDKKLAHWQYSELREAFDKFRKFAEQFELGTFVPLAPKSGNFGESNSVIYNIRGERFSNPIVVCKMMGLEFESTQALKEHLNDLPDEDIFTEAL